MQFFFLDGLWRLLKNGHLPVKLPVQVPPPPPPQGEFTKRGTSYYCDFLNLIGT